MSTATPEQGILELEPPDRIDEYPGSTPDQFRELAHYLKSHTPTKMKLCERSELSVSSESLPQFHTFLKFPVPIVSIIHY